MADVDEIRARIEAKRKAQVESFAEQEARDWAAYEAACDQHGYDACARLVLPRKVPGLPTFLVVHAASADIVTIHRRRILKSRKDNRGNPDPIAADNAIAEVGRASIAYPNADMVSAIKEVFPSVEKDAGIIARDMSQAQAEDEGKD